MLEAVFSVGSAPRLYSEDSILAKGVEEEGILKSETIKYGHDSQGTRTRERLRCRGSAAYTEDGPVLSSERAPQKNKTVTVNSTY
jgi:hypothetical protein